MSFFNSIFGKKTTPSPLPLSLQNCSELKKNITISFPSLIQAADYKERKKERTFLAQKILNTAKNWPAVDWRQFALMHNSTLIRHTAFEGGYEQASIQAWRFYIKQWSNNQGQFFSLGLSLTQLKGLDQLLSEVDFFYRLLPGIRNQPLTKGEIEHYASNLLSAIKDKLLQCSTVYLPIGYRPGVTNEGHVMPLKIVLKDGDIYCTFLNLGNGSQIHPLVYQTTTQDKVSFRFFPFKVPFDVFFGEMGHVAFCHLLRYNSDPPHPANDHYNGQDLYDIFFTLGELVPDLGPSPELFQAKNQRSGNCPEKGIKNICHDYFLDQKIPQTEIKKVFLNLHFCSLLNGYHTFQSDQKEDHRKLLQNAAEESGLALLKAESSLPQEEFLAAGIVIRVVKKATKKVLARPSSPLPVQSSFSIKNFSVPPLDIKILTPSNTTIQNNNAISFASFKVPTFSSNTSPLEQINSWISQLNSLPENEVFTYTYECVELLPLPTSKKAEQDLWDKVPLKEIPPLLEAFQRLLNKALEKETTLKTNGETTLFIEQFLLINTLYAISDKLARRSHPTPFSHFASPFAPLLVQHEPETFTSLPLGKMNQRYWQIEEYFSSQSSYYGTIFPFGKTLPIEQWVIDFFRGIRSQGTSHIRFLQQYLNSIYPTLASQQLAPYYIDLLTNKNLLPQEIHLLYHFAFLSQFLFKCKVNIHFPSAITYNRGKDEKGKLAALFPNGDKIFEEKKTYPKQAKCSIPSFPHFVELSLKNNLPIFKEEYLTLTTNEAVCTRLSEDDAKIYHFSESVYRDLLRITRKKDLKFFQALQWAKTNLFYLQNETVQSLLDHCFFGSGLFQKALQEEPSLIEASREFIRSGLNHYRNNPHHLSTILFLISTGLFFESQVAAVEGKSSPETFQFYAQTLKSLKQVLPKEDKDQSQAQILFHEFFLESIKPPPSTLKELLELARITFQFKFHSKIYGKNRYDRLEKLLPSLSRQNGYKLQNALSNPSQREEICHQVLLQFGLESAPKNSWEGQFPLFANGIYSIDFLKMSLLHLKKGTLLYLSHQTEDTQKKNLLQTATSFFWKNANGELESCCGTLKLFYEEDRETIHSQLMLNGKKRFFQLYHFHTQNIDPLNLDFLNYPDFLPFSHYVPLNKEPGDPDLLTYNFKTHTPYLRIDLINNQKMSITKLDEKGNPLPVQLANIEGIDESHPLYAYTKRFCYPGHLLCFVNTQNNQIEELYFYRHQLRFLKTSHGLESVEHPGYYFLPAATLEQLNHYSGAFVLENREGKRKALLVSLKLLNSEEEFSQTVFPDKEFVQFGTVYTYEINPTTNRLESSDPAANLYLSLLFKRQRNYNQARIYLKVAGNSYAPKTLAKENSFLLEFQNSQDHSPAGLAFDLQFVYFVVSKMSILAEENLQRIPNSFPSDYSTIINWGLSVYENYLMSMSGEKLSAIPENLRFSLQQERSLLLFFQFYHQIHKTKLSHLASTRLQLLQSKDFKLTFTIEPEKISTCSSLYTKILTERFSFTLSIDSYYTEFPLGENYRKQKKDELEDFSLIAYPNRVSKSSLKVHFPSLYEQAKACQVNKLEPFDFVLVGLTKAPQGGQWEYFDEIWKVLFVVRHFPHFFKDLSLTNCSDDQLAITTFNQIIDVYEKIVESQNFINFKKKLEKKKLFNYKNELSLIVPSDKLPELELPNSPSFPFTAAPFASFFTSLFSKSEEKNSCPSQATFLSSSSENRTVLEEESLQNFSLGYAELTQKKKVVYTFKPQELSKIKKDLQTATSTLHEELNSKRQAIIKQTNAPYKIRQGSLTKETFFEESHLLLEKDALQKSPLSPEAIMKEAVLRDAPEFILKHSPLLPPSEVTELIKSVKEYYHQLAVWHLHQEAFQALDKLEQDPQNTSLQHELAVILDYQILYDPNEHPEISYFKVTNGKLPRPEQVEIYLWILEGLKKGENRLFQFPAGAGKTSTIAPLLILRARMERIEKTPKAKKDKLLPVVFTTQAIYPVDKENLSITLAKFGEELGLLEVGLHMKLTVEELKLIFEKLKEYYKNGTPLLMTPQIYYALRLMYMFAALKDNKNEEEQKEKVKWLSWILAFFKQRCFMIMDEPHKNLNPLTRAIYGVGDYFFLPEEENALFLTLMKPLLGATEVLCENGKTVSQISRMQENLLGNPSPEDLKLIQKALATYMAGSPLFCLPSAEICKEFVAYWTESKAPQPKLLREWRENNDQKAHLAALTNYFLLDLLKEIVTLRTDFDHAPSIYPEEEFETPCERKTPSTAQFDDPYRTLALSCKGTFHRGLNSRQIQSLIEKMTKKDWQEQSQAIGEETPTSLLFKDWLNSKFVEDQKKLHPPLKELENLHLRDVSLDNPSLMSILKEAFHKNPTVLEYYLSTTILSQVGYAKEQLVCTPAHLLDFKQSVFFSATPLSQDIYPQSIHRFKYDRAFGAHVVTEYCKEENQTYIYPPNPDTFFSYTAEKHKTLFTQIQVLIDPGGYFCDFKNEDVAKAWLKYSDLDGIIYFAEGKALQVDREEKITIALRDQHLTCKGNELIPALKAAGLKWEDLNLGTYYDSSHTESIDIPQKKNIKICVFATDKLTSSHLIQGIMRARGFTKEQMQQHLIWVFQKEVADNVQKEFGSLCGKVIFEWTERNELKEMRKKIILRAFQEISYKIENVINKKIENHLNDPAEQIRLINQYRHGFLETRAHDPYAFYADHVKEDRTAEVLWKYAYQIYARFDFFEDLKKTPLYQELEFLISAIAKKISTIPTNSSQIFGKQVEQHCRIKRETEQIQYRPRPFDPLAAEGLYGSLSVTDPDYPRLANKVSASHVFKSPYLTKNFYFEKNQLHTARNANESLTKNFLKPIDFFLIVIYKGEYWAEAICNEIISTDLKEMRKCPKEQKIEHQVFLVTADGTLCQKGRGALEPNEKLVQEILRSQWMQDLIIDAALLRGQICHPERLLERLKTWEDFNPFWEKIVNSLPNPESANQTALNQLTKRLKQT